MAINSKHPSYTVFESDWDLMEVAAAGERAVKAQGTKYLPATPSQILDGQGKGADKLGEKVYQAYKERAVFPDYTSEAIDYYIGMLHQKPAKIELPAVMEPLRDKATNQGESLLALLRKIHAAQLKTGRIGLLLDMPEIPNQDRPIPYVATYSPQAIINWDESADHEGVNALELVVLDETGPVRQPDFTWEEVERYRVLQLLPVNETMPLDAVVTVPPTAGKRIYKQELYVRQGSMDANPATMTAPVIRGKALEQIPFVFVNTKDITAEPDLPPLLGLARLCMTIYRAEADYRQTLFMQGQDTLVTIGGIIDPQTKEEEAAGSLSADGLRVGAGARLDMNVGGDAKYIGVTSDGLSEQREALTNDRALAESKSGQMISPDAGKQESGEALTTRLSAQTASLIQIAKTSALALQNILRIAAEWMGANPEEVLVEANLEFHDKILAAKEVVEWMTARTMGAPLSLQSIHDMLVARGVTKLTLEEELELIAEEDLANTKRQAQLIELTPPEPGVRPTPAPGPNGPGNAPPVQ